MSNGVNLGVQVMGDNGRPSSAGQPIRHLTLEHVIEMIHRLGVDEYTTNGLIRIAESYPTQALNHFRRNINLMIRRVRAERRKETEGDDPNANRNIETKKEESSRQKIGVEDFDKWEESQSQEIEGFTEEEGSFKQEDLAATFDSLLNSGGQVSAGSEGESASDEPESEVSSDDSGSSSEGVATVS